MEENSKNIEMKKENGVVEMKPTKLLDSRSEEEQDDGGKKSFPKSVIFIIGNEFCERFSFYGMKAVLMLFLTENLNFDGPLAIQLFHGFVMLCYFTPIFGAIIADSFLGKFRTIFYISIIYAAGNIVTAVSAIPNIGDIELRKGLTYLGLLLIAAGTGGIKPCVSAFGGDQFTAGQESYLQKFFSYFYLSINAGSLLSMIVTPILRSSVNCFGGECYFSAFGVPACLMVLALVIFVLGKPLYIINPPKGNVVVKVTSSIGHAISQKWKSKKGSKSHWMDYADDKYDLKFIEDVKAVLRVLFLYLPLPIFWSLFDQQGSNWILQAGRMNGNIGGYNLKPDQLQVVNPILIIAFIPLFDTIIYPIFAKCNLLVRPLQRITVGGLLAGAAFLITGLLQLRIEQDLPSLPSDGYSRVNLFNGLPCNFTVQSNAMDDRFDFLTTDRFKEIDYEQEKNFTLSISSTGCLSGDKLFDYDEVFSHFNEETAEEDKIFSLLLSRINNGIAILRVADDLKHSTKGYPRVRIMYSLSNTKFENPAFQIEKYKFPVNVTINNNKTGSTNYVEIEDPARYFVNITSDNDLTQEVEIDKELETGGTYIILITSEDGEKLTSSIYTTVTPNQVHLAFQIPQYVVMTAGEIMFSITGLEFSYSQAPPSMKSVVQAAWLLTTAVGNLIVMIIATIKFGKKSTEFFVFAVLMAVDMVIFAGMAYSYKYVEKSENSESETETDGKQGKENLAYESEDTKM